MTVSITTYVQYNNTAEILPKLEKWQNILFSIYVYNNMILYPVDHISLGFLKSSDNGSIFYNPILIPLLVKSDINRLYCAFLQIIIGHDKTRK